MVENRKYYVAQIIRIETPRASAKVLKELPYPVPHPTREDARRILEEVLDQPTIRAPGSPTGKLRAEAVRFVDQDGLEFTRYTVFELMEEQKREARAEIANRRAEAARG